MTLIIAELGSSPAPTWDFEPWCRSAAWSGADAVKVQVWKPNHFPPPHDELKRPYEFPRDRLREFAQTARHFGLGAGASVFDDEAVLLAAEHCDWLKLAAREVDNVPLLTVVTQVADARGRHVYRSVSTLKNRGHYYRSNFTHLFAIQTYPAPMTQSLYWLLRAGWHFYTRGLPWGWSSHTTGALDCILAAKLGAVVIEKHFCLDVHDVEAPHSLRPHQFRAMVAGIRKGA